MARGLNRLMIMGFQCSMLFETGFALGLGAGVSIQELSAATAFVENSFIDRRCSAPTLSFPK